MINAAGDFRPDPDPKPKRGIYLGFEDYKLLSEILESIERSPEENKLLWKVKTIKHNIEMARLRKES
jgi:hypothetical protein